MPSLSLGLGPSNWEEILLAEIYERAKSLKHIHRTTFGGQSFEYAKISAHHSYYSDQKRYIRGEKFSIGRNSHGNLFVFTDITPLFEHDIVGFHEHLESTIAKEDHSMACMLELDEIVKDQTLFNKHAAFLYDLTKRSLKSPSKHPEMNGYFDRAIPEFSNIIKEGKMAPSEILREFKRQLDLKYN